MGAGGRAARPVSGPWAGSASWSSIVDRSVQVWMSRVVVTKRKMDEEAMFVVAWLGTDRLFVYLLAAKYQLAI